MGTQDWTSSHSASSSSLTSLTDYREKKTEQLTAATHTRGEVQLARESRAGATDGETIAESIQETERGSRTRTRARASSRGRSGAAYFGEIAIC